MSAESYVTLHLAGEYGVYVNGLTIQLSLPLKTYLEIDVDHKLKENNISVDMKYNENLSLSASEVEIRAKKTITKYFSNILSRRKIESKYNTRFKSDVLLGAGLEDNMIYLLLKSLAQHNKINPFDVAYEMAQVQLSFSRKTSSLVYLMPPVLNNLLRGKSPCVSILQRNMPSFRNWSEFEAINSIVDKDEIASWLRNADLIEPAVTDSSADKDTASAYTYEIMVVAQPKVLLPNRVRPSVQAAVRGIDLSRERPLLKNLATLTEQIAWRLRQLKVNDVYRRNAFEKSIISEAWEDLGRLFTSYHFTLNALKRTDPVCNSLVSYVLENRDVLGAKAVAGGPGGAALILYSYPKKEGSENILKFLNDSAIRFGFSVIEEKVMEKYSQLSRNTGGYGELASEK